MKKWMIFLLSLVLITIIAGCLHKTPSGMPIKNNTSSVSDVLEAAIAEETLDNENASEAEETAYTEEDIDVDLTTLSSIMVYSEVYNMMIYPSDYIGKTVKMEGAFASYYDETTNQRYYACIIKDATACCSQGLEFEPTDGYTYPDDYPADGENVCVIGVFDTYREGDYYYCTLRKAKIL